MIDRRKWLLPALVIVFLMTCVSEFARAQGTGPPPPGSVAPSSITTPPPSGSVGATSGIKRKKPKSKSTKAKKYRKNRNGDWVRVVIKSPKPKARKSQKPKAAKASKHRDHQKKVGMKAAAQPKRQAKQGKLSPEQTLRLNAIRPEQELGLNAIRLMKAEGFSESRIKENLAKLARAVIYFKERGISIPRSLSTWQKPGADPFHGTFRQAAALLRMYEDELSELEKNVEGKAYTLDFLTRGDLVFAVTFDKGKVKLATICLFRQKVGLRVYPAGKLLIAEPPKEYGFCGNWLVLDFGRSVERKAAPAPQQPPQEGQAPGEAPQGALPGPGPGAEVSEGCPVEHEAVAWAGHYANNLASGNFAGAEYMLWLEKQCGSGTKFGIGAYGTAENLEVPGSNYKARAWEIGPQVGLKHAWMNDVGLVRSLGSKVRLVYEKQEGESPSYHMQQENIKLGTYGEYQHQFNDRWVGYLVGEGWLNLSSKRESSWKGDRPENRGYGFVGAYGQYKINKDWQVRAGGGPQYTAWDRMWALTAMAEARYKEVFMFGPQVTFYPFGISDVYKGVSASDLTTWTGFVRLDLSPVLNGWYQDQNAERVQPIGNQPPAAPFSGMPGVPAAHATPLAGAASFDAAE